MAMISSTIGRAHLREHRADISLPQRPDGAARGDTVGDSTTDPIRTDPSRRRLNRLA
jgi:hypothetical protein